MATTSIEETGAELRAIARAAGDARGYFPALYSRVTDDVAAAIVARRFERGGRMEVLAVTFADYYLRAWRRDERAPRCWQASWDVAGDDNLLIAQHLLLGINAHVNHDLPQAVVDVAGGGALGDLRPDFDAVNDVLAGSYRRVLHDLDRVSRWTNEVATAGGGRLFNFSLRVARGQAWGAAERLAPLDAAERRTYVAELDRLVSVLAFLITRPVAPARLVVRLARRFEERDPPTVIAALLGGR